MPRGLTNQEFQDLKTWLLQYDVSFKNLNREFSDALPVAKLLKNMYPKLIHLHNYPPRNNTVLKQSNWETLNQNVLIRLGLQQTKATLENFAKSVPGAIETFLVEIMLMDKAKKSKGDENDPEQLGAEADIMTVTVNKMVGCDLVPVSQKMILYSIFEQVQRDSRVKDNVITAAQQKITHLENVIKLKANYISELRRRLPKIPATAVQNYAKTKTVKAAKSQIPAPSVSVTSEQGES